MIEKLKSLGEGWLDECDCYHETKADYLRSEILGFCGCGDQDEVMEYVGQMLLKLDCQIWGNYDDMPYMFFVYWANERGFAEHGASVRCSWLTNKGKELQRDIEIVLNKG